MPGNEFCGAPFKNAPSFHLMDQHGCGENDPNGELGMRSLQTSARHARIISARACTQIHTRRYAHMATSTIVETGPVFDPVHGVIHHFYQIHLAAPPGHGPDYGHFVSKDFVHWAGNRGLDAYRHA